MFSIVLESYVCTNGRHNNKKCRIVSIDGQLYWLRNARQNNDMIKLLPLMWYYTLGYNECNEKKKY